MSDIEVTVYIPNYNYDKFLDDSIKSVLNQSFKNFELIIIDDGSIDNSKKILKKYIFHKKIRIINQKNKGLVKCCNTAIRASNGKFVLRLDADDYLKKNALENFYKKIISDRNIGLVFSDYFIVDANKEIIKKNKMMNYEKNVQLLDIPSHGACSLIRKEYLLETNLYDEDIDRQDGYDLWLKFFNRYKVVNINKPLWYYRQHTGSLSFDKHELLKTRNKIYNKFVKKNFNKKKKCVCVIPARGNQIYSNCLSNKIFQGEPLIFSTIKQALNVKKIDKIILTTSDQKLIDIAKRKFKNKILYHNRRQDLAIENTQYRDAILSAINENYKKKPDYVLILNFEYPLRESFYIEKAINCIQIFQTEKLISVNINQNDQFYMHDGKGLKLLNNSKHNTLQLEKKIIYFETGGISVYNFNFYKKKNWSKIKNIGHIIIDKNSSFKVNNKTDLTIAKKLMETKK